MKEVLEYLRKIDALRAEGSNLYTTARNEQRDMTDDEEERVGVINDEIDRLQRQMEQYIRLNNIPKEQLQNVPPITPEPRVERQPEEQAAERRAAFFKYIRKGDKGINAEDRSLLEKRGLVEDTYGLYYVPQDLESKIVTALPQLNFMRQICGIRMTTRDKVEYPTLDAVVSGWGKLETGSAIAEHNPTPAKITIYAEDAQVLIKVGRDELMDSEASLEQAIVDQAKISLANLESAAFAVGRGHTTYLEPDGVTLDTTIISTYTDLDTADTIDTLDLQEVYYKLPAQYRPRAVYLMHSESESMVAQEQAVTGAGPVYGNYMWNPNVVESPQSVFKGKKVYNQDDMVYPASDNTDRSIVCVFGDFGAGYRIVDREGIYIIRLEELYAENGMVGFIVGKRVGGGVILPDAFRALDNNT
jgi:HK97 family phage major capsid protein